MNEIKICPICGNEMKYHPPGKSRKTGKPYNAFWSCPGCGHTEWTNEKYTKPSSMKKVIDPATYQKMQKRIEEMHIEKTENINWVNALNNAVYLIAHHPNFAKIKDEVELAEKIKVWRRNFYNETIRGPEIVRPSSSEMDKAEDLVTNKGL